MARTRKRSGKSKNKSNNNNNSSLKKGVSGVPLQGNQTVPKVARGPNTSRNGRIASQTAPKGAAVRAHVHAACAISNPFCPAAKGYRYPDGLGVNTIGTQGYGRMTLTIINTNGAATIFTPGAPFGFMSASGTTSGYYNWSAGLTTYNGLSLLSSSCSAYRVVSFGLVARVISNVTNTQGSLTVSTIGAQSNNLYSTTSVTPQLSGDYQEQSIYPLAVGMEIRWVSKPLGALAHQFSAITTSTTDTRQTAGFSGMPFWTSCLLELSNCLTGTAIEVQYFVNVEAQISPATGLQHVAPPNAPPNPIAIKARETLHQKMPSAIAGGIEAAENFFSTQLSKMAGDIVRNVNPEMVMSTLVGLL